MAGLRAHNIFQGADFSGYAQANQLIARAGEVQGQMYANIGQNLSAGVDALVARKQHKKDLSEARMLRASERKADREEREKDRAEDRDLRLRERTVDRGFQMEQERVRSQRRLDEISFELGTKQKLALESDLKLTQALAQRGVVLTPEQQQEAASKQSVYQRVKTGLEAVVSRLQGQKPGPAPMTALPRPDGSVVVGTTDDLAEEHASQKVAMLEMAAREAKSPALALRFGAMAAAEKVRLGTLQQGRQQKQQAAVEQQRAERQRVAEEDQASSDIQVRAADAPELDAVARQIDGLPREVANLFIDDYVQKGGDIKAVVSAMRAWRPETAGQVRGENIQRTDDRRAVTDARQDRLEQKGDAKAVEVDADKAARDINAAMAKIDDERRTAEVDVASGTLTGKALQAEYARVGKAFEEFIQNIPPDVLAAAWPKLSEERKAYIRDVHKRQPETRAAVPATPAGVGGDPVVDRVKAEERRLGRPLTDEETLALMR